MDQRSGDHLEPILFSFCQQAVLCCLLLNGAGVTPFSLMKPPIYHFFQRRCATSRLPRRCVRFVSY